MSKITASQKWNVFLRHSVYTAESHREMILKVRSSFGAATGKQLLQLLQLSRPPLVNSRGFLCHLIQHKLNLRRSRRHGSVAPLTTSRQRNNSVKCGRRRRRLLAVAVPERIVRRKVFGDGIQRHVRQVVSQRQVDASAC